MKITVGDTELHLPGEEYPEHTKQFMAIVLQMLDKAKDNPAMQLHVLALLCTGKPFVELLSKNVENSVEALIKAFKHMADTLVETATGGKVELSDLNIDDILGNKND